MSGLCKNCVNGTLSDCFLKGCLPLNGVERIVYTINQQMPGPTISVCKGDRIIIDVKNQMSGRDITIHWHGLHMQQTPWFDGVPMVTQCPITSGNTFRYTFEAHQVGSHLYHAHTGVHRSNGIIGKLIMRDVEDPNQDFYDYDLDEHSIVVTDWNNVLAEEKSPGTRNDPRLPDSLLLNGFGTYVNAELGKEPFAPIAVFYVERGKRHRFRLTNAGSHIRPLEFSIKNHNLTVIATDGYPIVPITVDTVVSLAGERFDVVVDITKNPDISETLLTVRELDSRKNLSILPNQEFARIIFVDDIANFSRSLEDQAPLASRPDYGALDTSRITLNHPEADCFKPGNYCIAALQQKEVPPPIGGNLRNESAQVIPLTFGMKVIQHRPPNYMTSHDIVMAATINNIASQHPPVPGLTQDDSHVPYCSANNIPKSCDPKSVCHCPHLINLELCKNYELLLLDDKGINDFLIHPMHLHGFSFQVIDMGSKEELESGRSAFANATHLPVIKDNVTLLKGGFVRIRFRSCNPGYWFFHCHLQYHMDPGMKMILKVGNNSDMIPPPANFPTCKNFMVPIEDNFDD